MCAAVRPDNPPPTTATLQLLAIGWFAYFPTLVRQNLIRSWTRRGNASMRVVISSLRTLFFVAALAHTPWFLTTEWCINQTVVGSSVSTGACAIHFIAGLRLYVFSLLVPQLIDPLVGFIAQPHEHVMKYLPAIRF
jgi:hypothetical protein